MGLLWIEERDRMRWKKMERQSDRLGLRHGRRRSDMPRLKTIARWFVRWCFRSRRVQGDARIVSLVGIEQFARNNGRDLLPRISYLSVRRDSLVLV
jgi:hypothetical protein